MRITWRVAAPLAAVMVVALAAGWWMAHATSRADDAGTEAQAAGAAQAPPPLVASAVSDVASSAAPALGLARHAEPASPPGSSPEPGPRPPELPRGNDAALGTLADAGATETERAQEALRAAMPELERCYDDWLRLQPKLGGRLSLRLSLAADGRVNQVALLDGGVGNVAFEGCLRSVLASARFPAPAAGGGELTLPLAFVAPPTPPPQLQPELELLCERMRKDALRLENAKVDPGDLLTVVISDLSRETPGLQTYFAELLPPHVPPMQRKQAFQRALGKALGKPWECPAFDALWDGKPL